MPLQGRGGGRWTARLGRSVQHVRQTVNGYAGLLELLPQLDEPEHGSGYPSRQHIERDEFAHAQLTAHYEIGSGPKNGDQGDFVEKRPQLPRHIAKVDGAQARPHVGGKLLLPAALHLGLDG